MIRTSPERVCRTPEYRRGLRAAGGERRALGRPRAGLELAVKLEYLARLEAAAQFDALVLPILFVHLPFALVAGRFAYALGERIHGTDKVGLPSPSRRTLLLLLAGYLVLAIAHLSYNLLI